MEFRYGWIDRSRDQVVKSRTVFEMADSVSHADAEWSTALQEFDLGAEMMARKMPGQARARWCLIVRNNSLECKKHSHHSSCAAADGIAAVLKAQGEDSWMHIF